jgi:Zn-dependent protease
MLSDLNTLPFVVLVLLIAFSLHEFAHAYTADKFGDPTPRSMGRVTLNPMVHLDILGTLLIVLVGFGWAKPVLINPNYFKRPRLMGIIVSIAGPLSNLLLAYLGVFLFFLLAKFGVYNGLPERAMEAVNIFFSNLLKWNLLLFLFNLLPLPPLDGYRIVQDFLPLNARLKVQRVEQWFAFVFLLIVFLPPLYNFTLGPLFSLIPQWSRQMIHSTQILLGM